MDNAELEKRLAVFQDIEAIKRLKAEYCDICDDAHNHGSNGGDFRRGRHLGRKRALAGARARGHSEDGQELR